MFLPHTVTAELVRAESLNGFKLVHLIIKGDLFQQTTFHI